jgi:hypothetical protein
MTPRNPQPSDTREMPDPGKTSPDDDEAQEADRSHAKDTDLDGARDKRRVEDQPGSRLKPGL